MSVRPRLVPRTPLMTCLQEVMDQFAEAAELCAAASDPQQLWSLADSTARAPYQGCVWPACLWLLSVRDHFMFEMRTESQ